MLLFLPTDGINKQMPSCKCVRGVVAREHRDCCGIGPSYCHTNQLSERTQVRPQLTEALRPHVQETTAQRLQGDMLTR